LARRFGLAMQAALRCGRGETGRRNGLESVIECPPGNRRCRTAQIRGSLVPGNPEPSQARLSCVWKV